MTSVRGVLLDIDGTLVDSNDAHARAWADAFAKHGYHVSFDKVRSCIGTGGDKLIQAVVRLPKDDPQAQELSRQYGEIFRTNYLPEVRPFPGAKALVEQMHQRGLTLIVASSAQKPDAEALLNIVGITQIIDHIMSANDVDNTKPDPDILQVALNKGRLAANEAVAIGDTPYDVQAAQRAGVRCIAFRCGAWRDRDLKGAIEIYDGPWHLLAQYDQSLLAQMYAAQRC